MKFRGTLIYDYACGDAICMSVRNYIQFQERNLENCGFTQREVLFGSYHGNYGESQSRPGMVAPGRQQVLDLVFLSSAVLATFFFPHGEIYQTVFLQYWKEEKGKSQNINAVILLLHFKKLSQ